MRWRIAISWARSIFLIVSGHQEPAFTVASFATTTTGRRESSLSGRRLPGPVRRGADLLLQLDHATLPPRAPDRRRHGTMHRGGGVPAGPVGCDLHGRRDVVHGARRPEPRKGRDRTDRGRRILGGRGDAHGSERGGALSREGRP